jgi:hypothetical protein
METMKRTPIKRIGFDRRYTHAESLDDSREETKFAKQLAEITMNWSRVEYFLYCLLESIDLHNPAQWMKMFFGDKAGQGQKEKIVKRAALKAAGGDRDFEERMGYVFSEVRRLAEDRNKRVHGLWHRQSNGVFEVRPMRLDQYSMTLDKGVIVTNADLADIWKRLDDIQQKLADLALWMMVHQQIEHDRAAERRRE